MAPKKVKKVVNQEELRRLMREKQRQASEKKRVESPFAKYNSLGHLSCILCNVQVKSDLLWATHILGKQHKEKVAELKDTKQGPQSQAVKRKATETEEVGLKRAKATNFASQSTSGLPADFFDKSSGTAPPKAAAGASLLGGAYDDDDDEEDEDDKAGSTNQSSQSAQVSGLPADFFDNSVPAAVPAISHSGSILKAEVPEKSTENKDKSTEVLPEGFFDDPVTDAKVRNVEAPKDQMDKEWEEFQKEMRQVNTKSEAIVAEEDEEGRLERQIDEIDEQIECYKRVEILRDKRDLAKGKAQLKKVEKMETDACDVEEEEDEEELLGLLSRDWRAKGALS